MLIAYRAAVVTIAISPIAIAILIKSGSVGLLRVIPRSLAVKTQRGHEMIILVSFLIF